MNFLKKNRTAILGGLGLLVLVWVYFTYFSGGAAPALTSTDANATVSQSLLETLQSLHTIKLDESIFSDPVFTSLTDFGVTLPSEDAGRPDPFAPLSFGSATGSGGLTLPLPGAH